jgi:hypothetical protein
VESALHILQCAVFLLQSSDLFKLYPFSIHNSLAVFRSSRIFFTSVSASVSSNFINARQLKKKAESGMNQSHFETTENYASLHLGVDDM